MIEHWEHLDHRLLNSKEGNLINRIILAHLWLEVFTIGRRISAKQLTPLWRDLAMLSQEELAALRERTLAEAPSRRRPGRIPGGGSDQLRCRRTNAGDYPAGGGQRF